MKKLRRIIFSILCMSCLHPAFSMQHHAKLWTTDTVIGSFSDSSPFKYYLEPQLRFIDDHYKFNQALFLAGLGYQLSPDFLFIMGPGWQVNESPEGIIAHEYRLFEQLNWRVANTSSYIINSRTRFEERKNSIAPGIAYRFRERVWTRIPFKNWQTHSLSFYDEVFFNLNHPVWVSKYAFEQNRAFVGMGTQLTKSTIVDVGYLNQYIHANKNEMNNVALVAFSVIM